MAVFSVQSQELRDFCLEPPGKVMAPDAIMFLWRAAVPGDFNPGQMPMVQVTTCSNEECEFVENMGGEAADLIDALSTSIWFRDRKGWRASWRIVRMIAAGRTIHAHDLDHGIVIRANFSSAHYREAA